jgi:hypothetical protein
VLTRRIVASSSASLGARDDAGVGKFLCCFARATSSSWSLSEEEPEDGVTGVWRRRLTFRDGGVRESSFIEESDSKGVENTPRRRLDFRGGGVSASSWYSSEDESDSEGVAPLAPRACLAC